MGEHPLGVFVTISSDPLGEDVLEVKHVHDDVLVLVHGTHYVDSVVKYGNGTQVWTIKTNPDYALLERAEVKP